jgi:Ca-activated chloride channel family protein
MMSRGGSWGVGAPRALAWGGAVALLLLCLPTLLLSQRPLREDLGEDLDVPTRLLFVFDASNSMNAFWGKSRRIDVATEFLSDALKDLYGFEQLELGLRVYGHQTAFVPGKVQDCEDSELVIPLGKGNNLLIAQALRRLEAKGTTPIARSLEWAAGDFPDKNARNVLILITDGIEACDGDPCAVSEALQAQGVLVKPFIIGIGLEPHVKEKFRCVGNYFDAQQPSDFAQLLQTVIDQALFETTLEVDLLSGTEAEGGRVTDLAFTFTDRETGLIGGQWVHRLDAQGRPDTLRLDPAPVYRLDVHTVPPTRVDSVRLEARRHNRIVVPGLGQGVMVWNWAQSGDSLPKFGATLFRAGTQEVVCTLEPLKRLRILAGTYDVHWATFPPTLQSGVRIQAGAIQSLEVPAPGTFHLRWPGTAYGAIVTHPAGEVVYKLDFGNPSGSYLLQPGSYRLVLRNKDAPHTQSSTVHAFDIESLNSHTFAP